MDITAANGSSAESAEDLGDAREKYVMVQRRVSDIVC